MDPLNISPKVEDAYLPMRQNGFFWPGLMCLTLSAPFFIFMIIANDIWKRTEIIGKLERSNNYREVLM